MLAGKQIGQCRCILDKGRYESLPTKGIIQEEDQHEVNVTFAEKSSLQDPQQCNHGYHEYTDISALEVRSKWSGFPSLLSAIKTLRKAMFAIQVETLSQELRHLSEPMNPPWQISVKWPFPLILDFFQHSVISSDNWIWLILNWLPSVEIMQ